MNRRITAILALAVAIIFAIILNQPAFAGHQWIFLHHEDQGRGQPTFEQCMPIESWSGHQSHIGDWYLGPYANNECLPSTPTPIPTLEPTNEPTQAPTNQPTATPTNEPTQKPTQEPTATSTNPPEPTPTIPRPTPTDIPCPYEEVGELFLLHGPNGEQAWFGSYQRNPNTGNWAIPNTTSQQKCLGWVAVNASESRIIYRDCNGNVNYLTYKCEGGGPCFAYANQSQKTIHRSQLNANGETVYMSGDSDNNENK